MLYYHLYKINKKGLWILTKLYSFDIFDTLVTRRTANPVGIFLLIEKELNKYPEFSDLPQILKTNFALIRKEAEVFARTNKLDMEKLQDVKFDDIYKIIQNNYNLSKEQALKLMSLEVNIETRNLVGIYQNINFVKKLLEQEKRVVLISDMYYPQEIIRNFLTNIDPIFKEIKIYVSSEIGKTKHHSDLFKFVKEHENIEYKNWYHFGDNPNADYKQAKRLGISAQHYKFENLLRYERNNLKSLDNTYNELSIGTSRLIRLLSEDKSPTYRFASSFAAPVLYGYVSWIVEEAQKQGYKTLYFVARDGFVLKTIADEIIKIKELGLKTKYIHGSRKAWRVANQTNILEYLEWVLSEYDHRISPAFLSDRLSMPVETLQKYLKTNNTEKPLSHKELKRVQSELANNADFINKLLEINNEKSKLVLEYMEQEVDFSENKIVFVDVFGSGRTQDLLANIIRQKHENEIVTFYFSLHKSYVENSITHKICYFSNINYSHYAIELLCRNTEGQTLGYCKKDGRIVPQKETVSQRIWASWGYNSYLQGLIDYTREFTKTLELNLFAENNLCLWQNYYRYFMKNLDKETAEVVGSIPYMDVGSEEEISECAPKWTIGYLIRSLLSPMEYRSKSALQHISAKRSNIFFRLLLEKKDNLSFLQRIFSIRNSKDKSHKEINIVGIKFALKNS